MRNHRFVANGILAAVLLLPVACARQHAPEKPLSEVLREERVAIPKGGAQPAPASIPASTAENSDGIPTGITADGRPYIGALTPSVVVWVFSDLQCPFCRVAHEKILVWARRYGQNVRFVFHHFPLTFHPHAMDHARLAVCAARMGRFWPVVQALFQQPSRRANPHQIARRFGLDAQELATCSMGREAQSFVDEDIARGRQLQIQGTPTFVVDGKLMYLDEIQKFLEDGFKEP